MATATHQRTAAGAGSPGEHSSTANPKSVDGYPIVKRESDAYAVYDADLHEIIAYAPGGVWGLSKTKALRERGTGHKVYYIGFPSEAKGNPFWPFNSFTKTTIKHVKTGESFGSVARYKGYTVYKAKAGGGRQGSEYVVPGIDRESRFEDLRQAKRFVDDTVKHRHNPLKPVALWRVSAFSPGEGFHGEGSKVFRGSRARDDASDYFNDLADNGYKVALVADDEDVRRVVRMTPAQAKMYAVPGRRLNPGKRKGKGKVGPLGYGLGLIDSAMDVAQDAVMGVDKKIGRVFNPKPYPKRRPIGKYIALAYAYTSDGSEVMKSREVGDTEESAATKALKAAKWNVNTIQVYKVMADHDAPVMLYGKDTLDELARHARKRNPEGEAASAFESFHGLPSTGFIELVQDEKYHSNLAEVGICCGMVVDCVNGQEIAVCLSGYRWVKRKRVFEPDTQSDDPTILCMNEKGTSLYLEGGDQSLDPDALGIPERDSVVIGDVIHLWYHTKKKFEGKEEEFDYFHELSESSKGPVPTLIYDNMNEHMSLSGGSYKIELPIFGTSVGIED